MSRFATAKGLNFLASSCHLLLVSDADCVEATVCNKRGLCCRFAGQHDVFSASQGAGQIELRGVKGGVGNRGGTAGQREKTMLTGNMATAHRDVWRVFSIDVWAAAPAQLLVPGREPPPLQFRRALPPHLPARSAPPKSAYSGGAEAGCRMRLASVLPQLMQSAGKQQAKSTRSIVH